MPRYTTHSMTRPSRAHSPARNSTRAAANHNGLGVTAVVAAIVLVALASIPYLNYSNQIHALADSINRLEKEHKQCRIDLRNETLRWAELKSPENLELALHRNGTHMRRPTPDQLVTVHTAFGRAARPATAIASGRIGGVPGYAAR